MNFLKFVTPMEFQQLVDAGLISYNKEDKNFRVTSQRKKFPRGKHYVEETKKIKDFLNNINK